MKFAKVKINVFSLHADHANAGQWDSLPPHSPPPYQSCPFSPPTNHLRQAKPKKSLQAAVVVQREGGGRREIISLHFRHLIPLSRDVSGGGGGGFSLQSDGGCRRNRNRMWRDSEKAPPPPPYVICSRRKRGKEEVKAPPTNCVQGERSGGRRRRSPFLPKLSQRSKGRTAVAESSDTTIHPS